MSRAAAGALRFPEVSPLSPREGDDIDPGDELLDVVDEQDRVVGQAIRREVRRRRLLHRFSSVLCRDPAGRLYVHRRTDDKDVYPGMYDMTAGGVLAAGETYLEAARRELAEELGVAGPEPRFLFRHRYHGHENPSWSALFEVTWDGPVRPQTSEIAWVRSSPLTSWTPAWRSGRSAPTAWRCSDAGRPAAFKVPLDEQPEWATIELVFG